MSKTVTIRIDDFLAEVLDHVAENTGRTKSQVIRDSLRWQFEVDGRYPDDCDQNDQYPVPGEDDSNTKVSEVQPDVTRELAFSFALAIVKLSRQLESQKNYVLARQILRAGTSIGANIEEATAAYSRKDFLHKMSIASKEARETNYWLRLIDQAGILPSVDLSPHMDDSLELIRLLTAIVKTTAKTMTK
jgi:four helix bundle protein